MTVGERYWFGHHVAGGYRGTEWDFTMEVPPELAPEAVVAEYRAASDASDAVIMAATSPDTLTALPVDGERRTLRWVLAHVTSETARHAGHADILRELIDGATGR
jgi:hypothetical protein